MKTTIRSNGAVIAIGELAALLCLTFVLAACKKEAAPSPGKVLVHTPVVEFRENVRSDSDASYLVQVRTEKSPEPQRDRADSGEQLTAIDSRTEIAALEEEELALVDEIITAKARCVLTAQSEKRRQAERAFELASQHYHAGTGTRIDFLNAQTALGEARISYVDALWDYAVARGIVSRTPEADLQH